VPTNRAVAGANETKRDHKSARGIGQETGREPENQQRRRAPRGAGEWRSTGGGDK